MSDPAKPSPPPLPGVSVVIPVFNSGESIRRVVASVEETLLGRVPTLEFILVNDGSGDGSPAVLDALAADNPRVTVLHLSRNFGQHNALLCGIREARLPVVATLDDDGQHPASELPRLLERLGAGADLVYGVPANEKHSGWRVLASWVTKVSLGTVMGANAARHTSAFRVFRTDLRDAFADFHSPHVVLDVLLAWSTSRFDHLVVEHHPRSQGTSTYTLRKLLSHAVNMMTGFTALPLRLASILGLFMAGFGFLLMLYVMARALFSGIAVPGFAFTVCAITLFSGVQLLCLGIIGEYMARMHFRTMNRPPYAIRSRTGRPEPHP